MSDAKPMFEPLSGLFRGDRDKIRRALVIFQDVTRDDLEQLDKANASRDRAAIGRLMHKMKSGCMQIGEGAAAGAILAVEQALLADGDTFAHAFALAREELDRMQLRVAAYLSAEDGSGEG